MRTAFFISRPAYCLRRYCQPTPHFPQGTDGQRAAHKNGAHARLFFFVRSRFCLAVLFPAEICYLRLIDAAHGARGVFGRVFSRSRPFRPFLRPFCRYSVGALPCGFPAAPRRKCRLWHFPYPASFFLPFATPPFSTRMEKQTPRSRGACSILCRNIPCLPPYSPPRSSPARLFRTAYPTARASFLTFRSLPSVRSVGNAV